LSSSISMPLLTTVLDTLFTRFQTPMISLLASPVMCAVGAGLRSALVVDLGWSETVVTSVYEYREVRCSRSIRAGRMLVNAVHLFLRESVTAQINYRLPGKHDNERDAHIISFGECQDIVNRLVWCTQVQAPAISEPMTNLSTVHEQDESEVVASSITGNKEDIFIPLKSCTPPCQVKVQWQELSGVCEETFLASSCSQSSFDDHDLPIHLLIYQHLLKLPIDVRAVCMSRVIFTGSGSRIPGLRLRVFNELCNLVKERRWNPVAGRGIDQYKNTTKIQRELGSNNTLTSATAQSTAPSDQDGVWHDAANAVPERDPVEEMLQQSSTAISSIHGIIRSVESIGAWGGGSLVCQLKILPVVNIERELWLQHGIGGASKPSEVDFKAQQRQSMGPGGLMRGGNSNHWTLGAWSSS
jgi:actin-related protein